MRRHLPATALLGVLLLVAAACGSGSDDPALVGGRASPTGDEAATSPDAPAAQQSPAAGDPAASCPTGVPLPDGTDQRGASELTGTAATLEAGDQFFAPTCLTGVSPGTVTLTIDNTGQALHNIQIDAQDLDVDVEPGETITVEVEVGSEPVVFSCKYHVTLGMHGALVPSG